MHTFKFVRQGNSDPGAASGATQSCDENAYKHRSGATPPHSCHSLAHSPDPVSQQSHIHYMEPDQLLKEVEALRNAGMLPKIDPEGFVASMEYIHSVQTALGGGTEAYREWLDIMDGIRLEQLATDEALDRLVDVLCDHPELLTGMNRFTRALGFRYEVADREDGCTVVSIVSPNGTKEIILGHESSGGEDEGEDAMDVEDSGSVGVNGPCCPNCGGLRG
ncbi:hypothetical protein PHLGIDRAFT_118498 [Phlebiopsis gigantea 11061_1 CR5-6]|uniref:Uncharacterized protein n=1 Tax=Phlebiopsis gigantea (strain 11061_1 CR5-6) TaxID=745531 RepID=A0A0C3PKS0_PHLG1|nr:hypothetical protein PHLGIDRAFT_118498 [Phlebiopsis gigantea 11061_1 CR5-6]